MASLKGSCYCKAIQYEIEGPPLGIVHCHCTMCRRLHGSGYSTWLSVSKQDLKLVAEQSAITQCAVSERTTKSFCSKCGTTLFSVTRDYPNVVGLLLGTVTTPVELRPTGHYFYSDKAKWIEIHDRLPTYGGKSGFEKLKDEEC